MGEVESGPKDWSLQILDYYHNNYEGNGVLK